MAMRIKAISVIILTAVVIIIFGIGIGLSFVTGHLELTIESDMTEISEIADKLITTEINLLKSDAATVSRYLIHVPDAQLLTALEAQVAAYTNFTALTVFDRDGVYASWGDSPTPAEYLYDDYIQRAFAGETLISTTRYDPSGALVFHLCIPLGDRVLSVTIPGMLFSDLLSDIQIWETGNIFIVDSSGTVISNIRQNWVEERYNFVEMAKTDKSYERIAATIRRMIEGKPGSGRFAVDDKERLCVFAPITASKVGWTVGVVAPISESPLSNVHSGLIIVGLVCLGLSVITSLFASIIIERPYRTISSLAGTLESQKKLLYTINKAATTLLRSEVDNYEDDIRASMASIATRAGVDRMRIWKNYDSAGKHYCMQLYEWSKDAKARDGSVFARNIAFGDTLPEWYEKLSSGKNISGLVRTLSAAEIERFMLYKALSLVVTPVFYQEKFWGFVGFEDCKKERKFSLEEESLLSSGGLLVANAILRNEMTRDLVDARETAIASTEAKSSFLANMSHEMRTPLNAVIGLSELTLDAGGIDVYAQDNLEKIYNSGVTLLSLINDILDISKIESGKFELVPVEYDIPSLINDTVTLNIVRIGSKPILFKLNIAADLPAKLFGDELRVKQIFNNLLSNAFKYTQEGTVEWSLSSETHGDDIWIISSVRDTGIGIRPGDLEKLFSEYNQVDTKSNRKIEGTGLGLSICKNMCRLMDGEISAKSVYGEGSEFTVRIRQSKISSEIIGAEVANNLENFHYTERKRDRSSKLVRTNIPYAKVLVVDDLTTNLDVARGMMKPYGMQIDGASSGQAAIDLVRAGKVKYNAIFMDHMMPGMDGIEATKIIRNDIDTEYAKTVPIIALTANAVVGAEEMFLKNGFQDFLSKPIDIMRMDIVINHWVRDKELEKNLSDGSVKSGENNDAENRIFGLVNIPGLDFEEGLQRLGGDEEIYYDILKSYVRNTPPLIDQLRNCAEDFLPDYAILVHGLKSSSLSIGAGRVGARAEKLEKAAKAGNYDFVKAENERFIEAAERLLKNLSNLLADIRENNPKPKKELPDRDLLEKLCEACEDYEVDDVDGIMSELNKYEYTSDDGLVEWLAAQVSIMGFKQIAEKLRHDSIR
ncbi:MAG: response regulator [Oscillospiraceae bacterium]|jgi:signal transduction histidine kinase/CheY-like chemotaxis protein/HPt (histidine-containing phosphotransfer) domain-containing protein|nr:response regulator [Oscillospiraceae bacterium]